MGEELKGQNILNLAALRLPMLLKLQGEELTISELIGKNDRRNTVKKINDLKKAGLIISINKDLSAHSANKFSLTPLATNLLKIIQNEAPTKMPSADESLVENYIKEMIKLDNLKKSRIIEELVYLSGRNTIEISKSTLQTLDTIICEEKEVTRVNDLLQFLNNIVYNKTEEREKYREIFGNKLRKIFSEKTPFAIINDEITRKTIRFLQMICGSESIYDELWMTYVESLRNKGIETSTPFREMLKDFYPEKRDYMRRKLINLYDNNEIKNEKIDTELTQLR